jgi:predicted esterase
MTRLSCLLASAATLGALAACQTTPAAPPATLASLGHQGLDPASGKAPKQLVVFFHGYTQKGEAMKPVAEALAARLPDAAFVFDNAPLTQGPGFSWYAFAGDTSASTKAASKALAIKTVADLSAAYHVPPQNIVAVGFSQGGGVATDAGICSTPNLKAVVSLAGVLESTCDKGASAAPAILVVHNDNDPTVNQARIDAYRDALKAVGYNTQLETVSGTTHWPAADGLKKAEDFIVAQLGGK